MKFIAALTLALATSASAFAPTSSMKKATALNVGEISWEGVGYEFEDDKWYYQPWSGIGEKQFYPQSHAGNRMPFFPPPTETVGEAPPAPEVAPAAPLPEAVPATPMPETVAASAPAEA
mmetsp:Transcript_42593/g.103019  ORF Transcript_42593/g.103019 Transcript_42593/m.103019 type:complete len:119 (-) Transcript_42593:706-1062(-)|eukprot:CAMPEP_0113603940 /NCGR_PEP_ID=MMETSP0017_2-20120614/1537_1 /TAXON_ID=2856 /ORGANISM="Cylindrotheca closterium" /LENGTH=118 /DNA_ID=CAMNT_0000512347 /DNA_START=97 /DNA_END=453 /DNA_ORIENTATION=- /assembly_acc=CAM_ASM_000147